MNILSAQNPDRFKQKNSSKMMLCGVEDFPTVHIGGFVLRLETDDPSPEVMDIARKELRETPEVRESALKELSAMLKEEETLYTPYDHEAFLIKFLRPTKFYPKSAFELAQRYFEFKNKHKNIYDGLVPSKESNVFTHEVINVLPRRDQFGRRILVLSLGKKWKHNKVSLDEVYKGAVLFMEAAVYEPETQICGAIVIFDMGGLSIQQTMQFTPPFAKRIVDWLQDCIPIRVKAIHIVNQPYIFNMVFTLFKPFLREKLKSRIYFHGNDRKSFHKHVDPSCLPKEFDGTLDVPSIQPSEWYNLMVKLEQEYEKLNTYGYKKQMKE